MTEPLVTTTEPLVTTTEAAFLLNISTGRLRELLNQGRVRDARKVGRLWMIPLNSRGMPEIQPGRRGPEGTWNKNRRSGNTFVHVLRKTIDYNRDNGTSYPAVAVKVGDKKDYCHALKIDGPCKIVYQPHDPNKSQAGGARLWIEVEPQYIVKRVYFSDGDYGPPPEVTEQRAKLKQKKSKQTPEVTEQRAKVKKKKSKQKKSKQKKSKIKGKKK